MAETCSSICLCHLLILLSSSSDESSWKRATELLVEVATHGEATGYEVPCLMVSAKDDLDSFPICIQESTRVRLLLTSGSIKKTRITYKAMFMHTNLFAGDTRYGNRASGIHQLETGGFQQLIPQNRNCSATSSSEYSRDGSRKKPQTLQQANQPLSYGCLKYVFFRSLNF